MHVQLEAVQRQEREMIPNASLECNRRMNDFAESQCRRYPCGIPVVAVYRRDFRWKGREETGSRTFDEARLSRCSGELSAGGDFPSSSKLVVQE